MPSLFQRTGPIQPQHTIRLMAGHPEKVHIQVVAEEYLFLKLILIACQPVG
jgi:hypothetical protein